MSDPIEVDGVVLQGRTSMDGIDGHAYKRVSGGWATFNCEWPEFPEQLADWLQLLGVLRSKGFVQMKIARPWDRDREGFTAELRRKVTPEERAAHKKRCSRDRYRRAKRRAREEAEERQRKLDRLEKLRLELHPEPPDPGYDPIELGC